MKKTYRIIILESYHVDNVYRVDHADRVDHVDWQIDLIILGFTPQCVVDPRHRISVSKGKSTSARVDFSEYFFPG